MVRLVASPSWRAAPARALAAVVALALLALAPGCTTMSIGVARDLRPAEGLAGVSVRVFDTADDRKAGRLTTRSVQSVLTGPDGTEYEAFGPEWWIDDADPGAYSLTVSYGALPGSPSGARIDKSVSLRADETVSVDVVTHGASNAAVGVLAAALLAGVVLGMASWVKTNLGANERRTESLPRPEAASGVPRGPAAPRVDP